MKISQLILRFHRGKTMPPHRYLCRMKLNLQGLCCGFFCDVQYLKVYVVWSMSQNFMEKKKSKPKPCIDLVDFKSIPPWVIVMMILLTEFLNFKFLKRHFFSFILKIWSSNVFWLSNSIKMCLILLSSWELLNFKSVKNASTHTINEESMEKITVKLTSSLKFLSKQECTAWTDCIHDQTLRGKIMILTVSNFVLLNWDFVDHNYVHIYEAHRNVGFLSAHNNKYMW